MRRFPPKHTHEHKHVHKHTHRPHDMVELANTNRVYILPESGMKTVISKESRFTFGYNYNDIHSNEHHGPPVSAGRRDRGRWGRAARLTTAPRRPAAPEHNQAKPHVSSSGKTLLYYCSRCAATVVAVRLAGACSCSYIHHNIVSVRPVIFCYGAHHHRMEPYRQKTR